MTEPVIVFCVQLVSTLFMYDRAFSLSLRTRDGAIHLAIDSLLETWSPCIVGKGGRMATCTYIQQRLSVWNRAQNLFVKQVCRDTYTEALFSSFKPDQLAKETCNGHCCITDCAPAEDGLCRKRSSFICWYCQVASHYRTIGRLRDHRSAVDRKVATYML